jgi:hypothetical protein
MKYIKKYSSLIVESVRDDLQEFCELNLAYLLDEDFVIAIRRRDNLPRGMKDHKQGFIISFGVRVEDGVIDNNAGFTWNDITNHFIPFLQRLSQSYTIDKSIMVRLQQGYPYGHETKMVAPTSMMNHDLMLDVFADKLIRNISISVEEE